MLTNNNTNNIAENNAKIWSELAPQFKQFVPNVGIYLRKQSTSPEKMKPSQQAAKSMVLGIKPKTESEWIESLNVVTTQYSFVTPIANSEIYGNDNHVFSVGLTGIPLVLNNPLFNKFQKEFDLKKSVSSDLFVLKNLTTFAEYVSNAARLFFEACDQEKAHTVCAFIPDDDSFFSALTPESKIQAQQLVRKIWVDAAIKGNFKHIKDIYFQEKNFFNIHTIEGMDGFQEKSLDKKTMVRFISSYGGNNLFEKILANNTFIKNKMAVSLIYDFSTQQKEDYQANIIALPNNMMQSAVKENLIITQTPRLIELPNKKFTADSAVIQEVVYSSKNKKQAEKIKKVIDILKDKNNFHLLSTEENKEGFKLLEMADKDGIGGYQVTTPKDFNKYGRRIINLLNEEKPEVGRVLSHFITLINNKIYESTKKLKENSYDPVALYNSVKVNVTFNELNTILESNDNTQKPMDFSLSAVDVAQKKLDTKSKFLYVLKQVGMQFIDEGLFDQSVNLKEEEEGTTESKVDSPVAIHFYTKQSADAFFQKYGRRRSLIAESLRYYKDQPKIVYVINKDRYEKLIEAFSDVFADYKYRENQEHQQLKHEQNANRQPSERTDRRNKSELRGRGRSQQERDQAAFIDEFPDQAQVDRVFKQLLGVVRMTLEPNRDDPQRRVFILQFKDKVHAAYVMENYPANLPSSQILMVDQTKIFMTPQRYEELLFQLENVANNKSTVPSAPEGENVEDEFQPSAPGMENNPFQPSAPMDFYYADLGGLTEPDAQLPLYSPQDELFTSIMQAASAPLPISNDNIENKDTATTNKNNELNEDATRQKDRLEKARQKIVWCGVFCTGIYAYEVSGKIQYKLNFSDAENAAIFNEIEFPLTNESHEESSQTLVNKSVFVSEVRFFEIMKTVQEKMENETSNEYVSSDSLHIEDASDVKQPSQSEKFHQALFEAIVTNTDLVFEKIHPKNCNETKEKEKVERENVVKNNQQLYALSSEKTQKHVSQLTVYGNEAYFNGLGKKEVTTEVKNAVFPYSKDQSKVAPLHLINRVVMQTPFLYHNANAPGKEKIKTVNPYLLMVSAVGIPLGHLQQAWCQASSLSTKEKPKFILSDKEKFKTYAESAAKLFFTACDLQGAEMVCTPIPGYDSYLNGLTPESKQEAQRILKNAWMQAATQLDFKNIKSIFITTSNGIPYQIKSTNRKTAISHCPNINSISLFEMLSTHYKETKIALGVAGSTKGLGDDFDKTHVAGTQEQAAYRLQNNIAGPALLANQLEATVTLVDVGKSLLTPKTIFDKAAEGAASFKSKLSNMLFSKPKTSDSQNVIPPTIKVIATVFGIQEKNISVTESINEDNFKQYRITVTSKDQQLLENCKKNNPICYAWLKKMSTDNKNGSITISASQQDIEQLIENNEINLLVTNKQALTYVDLMEQVQSDYQDLHKSSVKMMPKLPSSYQEEEPPMYADLNKPKETVSEKTEVEVAAKPSIYSGFTMEFNNNHSSDHHNQPDSTKETVKPFEKK